VSKASDDFAEPEARDHDELLRGRSRLTFLRLCVRAPRILIVSIPLAAEGLQRAIC
jgi:hypothetical protein